MWQFRTFKINPRRWAGKDRAKIPGIFGNFHHPHRVIFLSYTRCSGNRDARTNRLITNSYRPTTRSAQSATKGQFVIAPIAGDRAHDRLQCHLDAPYSIIDLCRALWGKRGWLLDHQFPRHLLVIGIAQRNTNGRYFCRNYRDHRARP